MPAPPKAEEGRITVCVRARPLNEREKRLNSPLCLLFRGGTTVSIYRKAVSSSGGVEGDEASGGKAFTFDRAYDCDVGQSTVYEDLGVPVLHASVKGFNTCIFAYGQTGSGKSYSMMGPSGGRDLVVDPGIIPRLSKGLFAMLGKLVEENKAEREKAVSSGIPEHSLPPELTTIVAVSYLEIYQERVNCLLNSKSENLRVREHPVMGVYVEGLTEVQVDSEESILRLMNGGNQSRHTAATKMNDRSSRSHAIFAISLIQKRTSKTKEGKMACTELRSKINLVDLAGSERAKSTGAEKETLREGANINKSLTVLGLVISALADLSKQKTDVTAAKHIPYRDSTLTFILKESLGGNSKTFMLSTLSPAAANFDETLSTLRYADRAKSIVTRATINETAGDKRIRELEEEVKYLREKMQHYKELAVRGKVSNDVGKLSESTNRTFADDEPKPDDYTAGGDEEEVNYINAVTPRLPRDAAALEAELHRAEEFIHKLTDVEKGRMGSPNVLELYRDTSTIRAKRNEPFLLNVDAAGDWVMEYLVAGLTYLGTEAGEESNDTHYIIVNGPNTSGIAPQHCCFVRQERGQIFIRPLKDNATYINDETEPLQKDTLLISGTMICIGDDYLQFKFTDPSAVQLTSRRRPVRGVDGTPVSSPLTTNMLSKIQGGETPKGVPSITMGSSVASATPPSTTGIPAIPSLRLKEVLQRRSPGSVQPTATTTATTTTHQDPMTPGGSTIIPSSRTTRTVGLTPKAARTTGKVMFAPTEEMDIVYRHTFLFLGANNCGKSAFRENLQKPDKWYSAFANDKLHVQPTFGVESSLIETPAGYHPVQMNLMELSGNGCFSLLEGILPTRRVTYVLCFSLKESPSLETLQPLLEFILCKTTTRDATVVLIGTHLDEAFLNQSELARFFADIEMEVNNYFRLLQSVAEMRPTIVGHFAVDNINRTVFSPSFSKMKRFPELLTWFGEQSIQRCRNDLDFPNAQIPVRTMLLAKKVRELYHEGKWCISSSGYKVMAKALDARYGMNLEELHRHTQLLMSWGILNHHYRHLTMKKNIILDVPWVYRLVAVLACCTPVRGNEIPSDSSWRPSPFLSCRKMVEHLSPVLPFDADEVLDSDVCHVLNRGVLTIKTARILFRNVLAEKKFGLSHLDGLLELLRSYDFIIMGSRLKLSYFFDGLQRYKKDANGKVISTNNGGNDINVYEDDDGKEDDGYNSDEEDNGDDATKTTTTTTTTTKENNREKGVEEDKLPEKNPKKQQEMFVLIPACFTSQPPSAFCVHLPSFLFGPFYRFTLNMVPHNFFSRVICRVSQYATKVYLGPVNARRVDIEDLLGGDELSNGNNNNNNNNNNNSDRGNVKSTTHTKPHVTACVVDKSQFWDNAAWVVGSNTSRALLRMVQHSLFVTFHDFDDDGEFYDGLRYIVRNIVYESPGVMCDESILCSRGWLEEDEKFGEEHGDKVYWRGVDENINSLEKIRQREQFALMTARVNNTSRPMYANRNNNNNNSPGANNNNSDNKDKSEEEDPDVVIPFVRNRMDCIDEEASLRRICADSLLTDGVLQEVKTALHAIYIAQRRGSFTEQCCATDRLVDALAQA
ncbi:putative Unc104-like kinesin [Trypanosoma theileri]|uniref:Putative Unc104-like kinesin n=1 Tax=Trypanosoma theileri TaxID=67003 RepID=A0A1X0P3U9_9TRYP|nr:putative Unc104-like kinesin [Trypanosoma theileri]ORC91602.1 putative Unc104-like kinesin [Trypanosoma theileri]